VRLLAGKIIQVRCLDHGALKHRGLFIVGEQRPLDKKWNDYGKQFNFINLF
jgi:hypothetical protein